MVRRYGEDKASADSIPFEEGGCEKRVSNLLWSRRSAKMKNEPSSKPSTTLSHPWSPSAMSIAIETGSCERFVAATSSGVDASSSRSSFRLHALSPLIESAAKMVLFDSITSSGGSEGRSDTTISLTAHCPCDQLWRNRYCCFHFVFVPCLTKARSSSHFDSLEE